VIRYCHSLLIGMNIDNIFKWDFSSKLSFQWRSYTNNNLCR
jgi:hypothetical protein